MSANKLETKIAFDRNLLLSVGIFDKESNGFMSVDLNGTPTPVTIGGKRLVLTTRELLREGEWEDRIAFHPEAEQISQGPSQVLNGLKNYIVERTKETMKTVIIELGSLAADPKRQKNLSAKAVKFLATLTAGQFDDITLKTLRSVLKTTSDVPEKRFLSMFLQNGGPGGALRTCQVAFPFMENDDADDTTSFFGVKMPRKTKDKALILALFNYVLGDEEERKTKFTAGVKDGDAPYLHSLLLAYKSLADHINGLIEVHGTACQVLKPLAIPMEWAEHLPEFDKFIRTYGVSVPALPGNTGVEDDELEELEEKSSEEKRSTVFDSSADDLGGTRSNKADDDIPFDGGKPALRRDDDRNDRDDRGRNAGTSMSDIFNRRKDRDTRDSRDDRSSRDRDRGSRGSRSRRDW